MSREGVFHPLPPFRSACAAPATPPARPPESPSDSTISLARLDSWGRAGRAAGNAWLSLAMLLDSFAALSKGAL